MKVNFYIYNNFICWAVIGFTIFMTPKVWSGTPWSQFHGDRNHDGFWGGTIDIENIYCMWKCTPEKLSQNGVKVSKFNYQTQPCVSQDGKYVFIVGYTNEEDMAQIIALSTATGSFVWVKDVYSYKNFDSISSPVFYCDYVYWIGSDKHKTVHVYKINAKNGSTDTSDGGWEVKIENKLIVNASPLIADGKFFFSTYADYMSFNASHYALNISDGSIVWINSTAGGAGQGTMVYRDASSSSSTQKYVYQTVYVGGKHTIGAFDCDTGKLLRTGEEFAYAPFQTGIALSGNKLYLQVYNFYGNGKLYAMNADTLKIVWEAVTPGSGDGTPAVDKNGLCCISCDSQASGNIKTALYNTDGTLLWTLSGAGGWTHSPVFADDFILIGKQTANKFYFIKEDTIRKTIDGSGPPAFGKNCLFTCGYNGTLYGYITTPEDKILSISVSPDEGGSVSPSVGTYTLKQYEPLVITATPASGYTFTGWTASERVIIADTSSASTGIQIYDDAQITANFTESPYAVLSVVCNPDKGGSVSPSSSERVEKGVFVAIHARPSQGWCFYKWECSSDTVQISNLYAPDTFVKIYGDTNLTAIFKENTSYTDSPTHKFYKFYFSVNSYNHSQDKIIGKKLPLDDKIVSLSSLSQPILYINGAKFDGAVQTGTEKNRKYIFKYYETGKRKIYLYLNLKKYRWGFCLSNYEELDAILKNMSTESRVNILLILDGIPVSNININLSEMTWWKYRCGGTKRDEDTFSVISAYGKNSYIMKKSLYSDSQSTGKKIETAMFKGRFPSEISFSPAKDKIKIKIDNLDLTIDSASDLFYRIRTNVYKYIDKTSGVVLIMDFRRLIWSLKITEKKEVGSGESSFKGFDITPWADNSEKDFMFRIGDTEYTQAISLKYRIKLSQQTVKRR